MSEIVEKARKNMAQNIKNFKSDPYHLMSHIAEVEKWAKFMLKEHPEADEDIVMLSVFLHDIGHYPVNKEEDHAVTGEKVAKNLLEKWKFDRKKIPQVLHCVRAHRCSDVMPQTIEAKIMAFIDSASHMTTAIYFDIIKSGRAEYALGKLERDYRDLAHFPEMQTKLKKLYESWKQLLTSYKELRFD